MKIYKFDKQLKIGNKGENSFIKFYHKLNPRKSSENKVDIIINDNDKVEIKTDTTASKNFFMERYGDIEKKKDGGPWRSKNDDIPIFVYFFINEKIFYWFDSNTLCDYLNKNLKKFQKRSIFNYGYASLGYLIPRIEIEHLAVRIDKF